MLRKFVCLLAVMVFAVAAENAQAGLLSSVITYDGEPDVLQDNSVAWIMHDGGVAGRLDVGDVIAGFVRIEQRISEPELDISPNLGEMIIVFAAQITGSTLFDADNLVRFTLGESTTAGALLSDLLPAYAPFAAGAIAAVISAPASESPVNPATQSIATALANLNDTTKWSLDATLGFSAGPNAFGDTDFFEAQFADRNEDDVITLADIAATPLGGTAGSESGGFSVLDAAPGITYHAVEVGNLAGSSVTEHEVVLASASLFKPTSNQAANGYQFADQAVFVVNATPEPSSMVLLGLGAFSACGFSLRRRRQRA